MQNDSIIELAIGCNQIGTDGAIKLFDNLKYHPSIISINLANSDCYKSKIKIGYKGAVALGDLLETNHLIQFLNLSNNSLTSESLHQIIYGLRSNPNIISLNISQNDLGTNQSPFNNLLGLFDPSPENPDVVCCQALEELNLSTTQITNHQLQEFSKLLKTCSKTKIHRLDLSYNKINVKGLLSLLQALRHNLKVKISHLLIDKTNLEMGSSQEKVNNFREMQKILAEYIRISKSLKVLSMNSCQIGDEIMASIGKGMQVNENIESLSIKHNNISDEGMVEIIKAFSENEHLKLKSLDFSSNKLSDICGVKLANSLTSLSTLQHLILRDNDLSIESGDAIFFLVQSQRNLYRIQLDMNTIRYGTLLDIERECKRNRKNLVGRQIEELIKNCQEGIEGSDNNVTASTQQTPMFYPTDSAPLNEIDQQIFQQEIKIIEGQKKVIQQEERVHEYISEGHREIQLYQDQKKELEKINEKLDEELAKLDHDLVHKQKECTRKIDFEFSLLDRCRDFIATTKEHLQQQRQELADRSRIRRVSDDVLKLRLELDKALRDQRLMSLIADNYVKEIQKRSSQIGGAELKPKTPGDTQRQAQSANQMHFYNKKQQQALQQSSGNLMIEEGMLVKTGDIKKGGGMTPMSSNTRQDSVSRRKVIRKKSLPHQKLKKQECERKTVQEDQ